MTLGIVWRPLHLSNLCSPALPPLSFLLPCFLPSSLSHTSFLHSYLPFSFHSFETTKPSSDFLRVSPPSLGNFPIPPTHFSPRPAAAMPLFWSGLGLLVHGPLAACSEGPLRSGSHAGPQAPKRRLFSFCPVPWTSGVAGGVHTVTANRLDSQHDSRAPGSCPFYLCPSGDAHFPFILSLQPFSPLGTALSTQPTDSWLQPSPCLWAVPGQESVPGLLTNSDPWVSVLLYLHYLFKKYISFISC